MAERSVTKMKPSPPGQKANRPPSHPSHHDRQIIAHMCVLAWKHVRECVRAQACREGEGAVGTVGNTSWVSHFGFRVSGLGFRV